MAQATVRDTLNESLSEFEDYGYVVIPDLLSAAEVEQFQESLSATPSREATSATFWGERQLLPDPAYVELLRKPRFQEALHHVLPDVQLIDIIGVERHPEPDGFGGGVDRGWHLDCWQRPPSPVPISCTSLVYLQDMTDEVGPTYVIPGSNKWLRYPQGDERTRRHRHETAVRVNAGACLVFHPNLWHSATPNHTDRGRRTLNINWAVHYIRRLDRFYTTPLPDHILKSDDPELRVLFGLELPPKPHMGGSDYNATVYGG